MTGPFRYEGETLRIRSLGRNSGVIDMGRADTQKVVLEHKGARRWIRDAATYIRNDEPLDKAVRQLGFRQFSEEP